MTATAKVRQKKSITPIRIEVDFKNFDLANTLIAQARAHKADVDYLNIAKSYRDEESAGDTDSIFRSQKTSGIELVRNHCRLAVLNANGVLDTELGFNQFRTAKAKFVKLGSPFSLCLWRDACGEILAQGQLEFFKHTPLMNQLMALRETGRHWQVVLCWNLLFPDVFVKEENRVLPKVPSFLFEDEVAQLSKEKKLIIEDYHDMYEEAFTGYLITNGPVGECVYMVRAYLFD